jgi:hypothetical protein
VKTLPREEPKVLLGDNLAAHLSPYVIMMCKLYNIRYGTVNFTIGYTVRYVSVWYGTYRYRRVCEANFVIVLNLLPFVWQGWGFSP